MTATEAEATPRRRGPQLDMASLFDEAISRGLWESLEPEYRSDHFDLANLPELYRGSLVGVSDGARGDAVATIAGDVAAGPP